MIVDNLSPTSTSPRTAAGDSSARAASSATEISERLRVLRVLRGQPRWVIPSLVGILVVSALLYTWNIGYSGLSTYYAAGVRSMLESNRAFAFGALDPTSTLTLDKLSGFLIPQAISAKIFGFHAWSLSLPQAFEGVVAVFASYVIGARWRGPRYGIAIAGVMAITPMLAAMFGRPMEDGMLTGCLVLAFAALQRAIMTQRVGWLILSGAWVAVGFQAKMMQSWLFLPALVLAYFLGTRLPLLRKLVHIAVALVICLLLSLSWMTAIQLTPAAHRPYIDGTTNNNIYSMVLGYNGFDRIIPGIIPGAVPQLNATAGGGQSQSYTNDTATSTSGSKVTKLLMPQFSTQIGWLYPAAAAGIVFELVAWRRRWMQTRGRDVSRTPRDARLGTSIGFIVALVVPAGVLSLAFVPHATYFAVLGLPLAALAVGGFASAIATFRRARDWKWTILPALIAVQVAWIAVIVELSSRKLEFVLPVAAILGAASIAGLLRYHLGRNPGGARSLRLSLIAASAAALIGPLAWSVCVIGPGGGGSASDAFAGPRLAVATVSSHRNFDPATTPFGLHAPFTKGRAGKLYEKDRQLVAYVSAHNAPGAVAFATDAMPVAVAVILRSRAHPMAMGGFSREAPTPSLARIQRLIASGRVRFFLLTTTQLTGVKLPNPTLAADRKWVFDNCRAVTTGSYRQYFPDRQTLFDCGS